jgi:uncharacterized membrane protein
MMAGVTLVNLFDAANPRRWHNTVFWGIYAVTLLAGSHLPDVVSGALVLVMVAVASAGRVGLGPGATARREEREASAKRWGNRLFIPALVIPAVTLTGTLTLKGLTFRGVALVDPRQVTLIALGLATLLALVVGLVMLRPPLLSPIREARRLMDSVGWAAVLPQMLASLGALFAAAGVGNVISTLLGRWIPLDVRAVVVAAYTLGMALFTVIMGNAFAAFPVMTAALGLPLVVHRFGGDPSIMAAIGMLSGFCGTLMTPMAANFNIVPAALLELPDQHAVIKVQIPTGLLLLGANTILMYLLVFPH